MKTLICVPCMDQVPARFAASLAMLQRGENTEVAFQIGSLVYMARNDLSKLAIKKGADFVLWLDSDMVFSPDTLQQLMEDYKAKKGDIISGLYFRRVPPFSPVLFSDCEVTAEGPFFTEPKEIPEEIFEVAACGFGCVLMPTDVLIDVFGKFEDAFGPLQGFGEDLSFCWRARQCGYRIVCDPAVSCGHVGHQVVNRQFYEAYHSHGGDL